MPLSLFVIAHLPFSLVQGRGGQSALRFARLREEKRHNYVRKIAELAVQNYITNDKVAEVGPVQVRAEREHTVWIPPVVGGAAVFVGAALLVLGSRRPVP